MRRRHVGSTYRLQLNGLGFAGAADRVPFLHWLGVETCYVSPIARARAGSPHGYDVVDPTVLDPALGTPTELERLLRALADHDMRLLVDIVPNHMAASTENRFFADVLRHGRASPYAKFFDIAWHEQGGKVLLPALGRALPQTLADGELGLGVDGGDPVVRYFDRTFPLDPATPPADGEDVAAVLERQHYRLADWRVANRELNYRRFFDINDLIALRQEDPAVFAATHALVVGLADDPRVAGLRVDHVDGLHDPAGYLDDLRAAIGPDPVVLVEKILQPAEQLPDWPVDGTTGYEFAATAVGLFVDPDGAARIATAAAAATGDARSFEQRAVAAKRAALEVLFPHQLDQVARRFVRAGGGEADPAAVRTAVAELTAQLPVYRTYRRAGRPLTAPDRRWIRQAFPAARAVAADPGVRAAIEAATETLLGPVAAGSASWAAVAGWQQLSSPVTAKGVEDTALYDAGGLLAAADVGADPDRSAVDTEEFHARMRDRRRRARLALNATSTHDSKRSEDVRCRLAALSEIPDEWEAALRQLRRVAAVAGGDRQVDPADQRYVFETLVGAWPLDGGVDDRFLDRIEAHLTKAAREAKRHSGWLDPDTRYERALGRLAARVVNGEPPQLRRTVEDVVATVESAGATNSLAATLLKATAPGVPDVYQGCDRWAFTLVDPDNRRPVDWAAHEAALAPLPDLGDGRDHAAEVAELLGGWRDGRVKLHVLRQALLARRADPRLCRDGRYVPLPVTGSGRDHLVAFARVWRGRWLVAVVPRLVQSLVGPGRFPVGSDCWGTTSIGLPSAAPVGFTDRLTGRAVSVRHCRITVAAVLTTLPVTLLVGDARG